MVVLILSIHFGEFVIIMARVVENVILLVENIFSIQSAVEQHQVQIVLCIIYRVRKFRMILLSKHVQVHLCFVCKSENNN